MFLFLSSYARPVGEIDLRQASYVMQSGDMRVLVKMPFAIEIGTTARLWVINVYCIFKQVIAD